MSSFLPQYDPDPEAREEKLADAREEYQYSYDYISPLAMVQDVPPRDKFAFCWWLRVLQRIRDVIKNEFLFATRSDRKKNFKKLDDLSLITSLRKDSAAKGVVRLAYEMADRYRGFAEPPDLEMYTELFQKIGLPPIAKDFHQDDVFAYMRIAGPNPVLLQQLERLDDRLALSAETYGSVMSGDHLEAALEEGRLFLVDYAGLEAVEDGSFPGYQKFLYAPLALFAVDKTTRNLMPVAIQSEQTPGEENPVLTPNSDRYNWLIAKTIVEVADANYHEAITHLGRTHLFVEPFVLATRRQLAPNHPLSQLLRPHFKGTLAINFAAHESLVSDGGAVDKLASGTIESTRAAAVQGVQSYRIDDAVMPRTFKLRGVDDVETLPTYPYRDDSLLYWDAIERWVSDYLKIWYRDHGDLANDQELKAWFAELQSPEGGRLQGLREGELDLAYLIELVTLVIFTASVQHAAVNFPQYDLMSYAPNMPLACYAERPRRTTGATEGDYLRMLPPLEQAKLQMNLGYVLGKVHYTRLGKYPWRYFKDSRVKAPMKAFQHRVKTIDEQIRERNQTRRAYKFLLASGIPQSINI